MFSKRQDKESEKTKAIKNIHVILSTKEERKTINVNFKMHWFQLH